MLIATILSAILLTIVLIVIPHILWLVALLIAKLFNLHISYAPFGWSSIVLIALMLSIMAYGYYIGRWRVVERHIEYSHPDIPHSFDGYRIVHISDLHLTTFDDKPSKLSKIVNRINGIKGDVVCFTGDLINHSAEEAEPYIEVLKEMQSQDGIFSVLGNHDFMLYSMGERSERERKEALDKLIEHQEQGFGWRVLRNENCVIERNNEKITIIGVDNQSCSDQGFHTIAKGDLSKAMERSEGFRILLTHDPSHWGCEVLNKVEIPLTLSGHTHAAQFRILGWTPASWVFKYTSGLYNEGNQSLHINIGLGCTLPLRIGANPEITVITLRAK